MRSAGFLAVEVWTMGVSGTWQPITVALRVLSGAEWSQKSAVPIRGRTAKDRSRIPR